MGVTIRDSLLIIFIATCALAAGVSVLAQSSGKGSSEKKPSAAAPGGSSGDAEKGRGLYTRTCAICHFSKNTETKIGPGLKGIYKRGKFADGKKVDDANMSAWIETGGKNMPPFKGALSPQEISDLIAYIRTL